MVLLFLTSLAAAQVTTAVVRGVVKGAEDGVVMAGVEVTLVDESTGAARATTTNERGEFAFTNLQVGGPYRLRAELVGFKAAEEQQIFLTADRSRDFDLGLRLQEEVIEVAGTSVLRNTSNRTVVTAADIDASPSVNRDPRDVVRRNPEAIVEGRDRALSIGGNNTRFNSITVDGVRQDDDFGLNLSGYPTRRSPISLSAVQELTVDSSPFDVRYGKFLGGNVNIVTKSGTNEFRGSLVATGSSDALLGSQSRNDTINVSYREVRYGATVGGPIIKDRVHFLASVEGLNGTTPVDVGTFGSGSANEVRSVTAEQLAQVQDIARRVYGFDVGVPALSSEEGDIKLLGKIDVALTKQHRAAFTYQRTRGNSIQVSGSSATNLSLSSNWYDAQDTLNTFSGKLYSDWSPQLSTRVEANVKLVQSDVPPLNGNGFMAAQIRTPARPDPTDPTRTIAGGNIFLGPDEFRHANELSNDIIHAKAEANYLMGSHLFTGGVELEQLRINNLFVPASNGVAIYDSIADFEAMRPDSLRYSNAVTLNPADGAADWTSNTLTAYLQDQFKLRSDLTVQAGIRTETYLTGADIPVNPNFVDRYATTAGIDNTSNLNGRSVIMPRLGLSWLPVEQLNVRAGVGLYSGGTPSVWVSNNYTNDGLRTSSATIDDDQPGGMVIHGFNGRDIPDELRARIQAGNGNVDLLDPDFKIPSTWKVGAGADYALDIPGMGEMGKNLELKVNYTFSRTHNGVNWVDLRRDLAVLPNNTPVGTTIDGRPMYATNFNVNRGYDMMLTNTQDGHGHVASVMVQKAFPFGFYVSGAYAHQNVKEVSPGTSSRSVSNYGQSAVTDPQHPDNATSNYERAHRLTAVLQYNAPLLNYVVKDPVWKQMKTGIGMFIESRSGQPFSWTFGDANGGTTLGQIFGEEREFSRRNRQLLYVPTEAETCMAGATGDNCRVFLTGMTPEQFNDFLNQTGLAQYRGKITPRNAFRSPWAHRFDVRITQDLMPAEANGQRMRFVLDIENVGNMLNTKWGRAQASLFPYTAAAVNVAADAQGRYTYSELRPPNPTRVDVLQSVWRLSIGLMYDF